ncbi:MAG: hypothetical protein Alpg2KO_30820 [Alphaproteobacteria bacterium]
MQPARFAPVPVLAACAVLAIGIAMPAGEARAHGSHDHGADHSHSHDHQTDAKDRLDVGSRQNISASDYRAMTANDEAHMLLDVRENWELAQSSVPGATHIPMGRVMASLSRLPDDRPIVVMCRSGNRSATVSGWLRDHGYTNVINLQGGITALQGQ